MSAPLPPADLSRRDPQLFTLAKGHIVHRFYTVRHDPIFFDKSQQGRLNAPDGSYGVLYVARDVEGAFAETFLRRPGLTLIDDGFLRAKAYAPQSYISLNVDQARRPRPGDARCNS